MMLDDLGLIPTLRRYSDSYQEKNNTAINLHILGDERRLESHREVILFRSIQELINNARDHARATTITLTIDMGQEVVAATVEDNGQGFNPEAIFDTEDNPQNTEKAMGLKTLRERLELIGGSLEIQSEEAQGSRITARIPAGKPPGLA
jgi:two-component system sensor histidine kinase DegS